MRLTTSTLHPLFPGLVLVLASVAGCYVTPPPPSPQPAAARPAPDSDSEPPPAGYEPAAADASRPSLPPPRSRPPAFAVEPTAGPVGTMLTIFGDFSAVPAPAGVVCTFAGAVTVRPVRVSTDRVVVKVPPGATTGPVNVVHARNVLFTGHFTVTGTDDGLLIATPEGSGLLGEVYQLPANTGRLPDFNALGPPAATIVVPALGVSARRFDAGFPGLGAAGQTLLEWFAIRFAGLIDIPEAGNYQFRLNSDDGARLYIDNSLIIDNDGVHPPKAGNGTASLAAGKHEIVVEYFQGPRFEIALELFWQRGGGEWTLVPPEVLSRHVYSAPECAQPPGIMCCQAMMPACQDCQRRADAAMAEWQRHCGAAPPAVDCSEPPRRACCKALTPACRACAAQAAEERERWQASCGG